MIWAAETHLSLQVTCQVTANTCPPVLRDRVQSDFSSTSTGSETRLRSVTLWLLNHVQLLGLQSHPVSDKKSWSLIRFHFLQTAVRFREMETPQSSTWRQCLWTVIRENKMVFRWSLWSESALSSCYWAPPPQSATGRGFNMRTDRCCLTAFTVQRNRLTI